MRLEKLREAIRAAVERQPGTRVVIPQATAKQARRALRLLERVAEGAPVVPAAIPWEVYYTADALPENSTPAWTRTQSREATVTVGGGILAMIVEA